MNSDTLAGFLCIVMLGVLVVADETPNPEPAA